MATAAVFARSPTNFGKLILNKAEKWAKVIRAVPSKRPHKPPDPHGARIGCGLRQENGATERLSLELETAHTAQSEDVFPITKPIAANNVSSAILIETTFRTCRKVALGASFGSSSLMIEFLTVPWVINMLA